VKKLCVLLTLRLVPQLRDAFVREMVLMVLFNGTLNPRSDPQMTSRSRGTNPRVSRAQMKNEADVFNGYPGVLWKRGVSSRSVSPKLAQQAFLAKPPYFNAQQLSKLSGMFMKTQRRCAQRLSKVSGCGQKIEN